MVGVSVSESTPLVTPTSPALLRRLWLPAGLLQRTRWLMLIAALLTADVTGVEGVLSSAAANLAWPLAVAALAGMTVIWIFGYLRGRFSLVTDLLNAGALVLLGSASVWPQDLAYPVYASAWMRALHATPRDAARALLLYCAAFLAGGLLTATPAVPVPTYVASRSVVAILLAACFGLVGLVLATYERTVARERRLRQAAHSLAEARDRQTIYATTLSAARDLLTGVGSTEDATRAPYAVELAVGSAEDATVVASAGSGAATTGSHLRLDDLPPAGAEALHRGEVVELSHAAPALWSALQLTPRSGTLYAFPLAGHGTLDGAVLVGAGSPLESEVKDDLETLADLAALAVESQLLLDAHRSATSAVNAPPAPHLETPDVTAFDRVRARLGTAVDAAANLTTAHAAAHAAWRMPSDLATRVRWLFLALATVLSLGTAIPALLDVTQGVADPLLFLALTSPLWLGAWFLFGYRRSGFPLAGDVLVGALLFAVMTVVGPSVSQFALFSSMFFRAVYGTRGRVALAFAIHVAALFAAWLLVPGRGMGPVSSLNMLNFVVILAALAGTLHFIASTLSKHERALVRGRVLRVSGAHLVAATTRAHVFDATLDGARALLAGAPGATVLLATSPLSATAAGDNRTATANGSAHATDNATATEDLATVAAASGSHALRASGLALHIQDLPESLRLPFHQGTPVDQPRAEPAVWRAFDLEGTPGSLYAIPLHAAGQFEGALVTAVDSPLDPELKDLLQTLASIASLSLEDAILVEPTSPPPA